MYKHSSAKYAEDDISSPLNVLERRGYEISECEIECPVCGCGERDSFTTDAKREELGWVDPGDWSPGWCEGRDEEVGASDDYFGWFASYDPGFGCDAVKPSCWSWVPVGCHYTCEELVCGAGRWERKTCLRR